MYKIWFLLLITINSLKFKLKKTIKDNNIRNMYSDDSFTEKVKEYYYKITQDRITEIMENKEDSLWLDYILVIMPNDYINILITIVYLIFPIISFIFINDNHKYENWLFLAGNFFLIFIFLNYAFNFLKIKIFFVFCLVYLVGFFSTIIINIFMKDLAYYVNLSVDFIFLLPFLKFYWEINNFLVCFIIFLIMEIIIFSFLKIFKYELFFTVKYYINSWYFNLGFFYIVSYLITGRKYYIIIQLWVVEDKTKNYIYIIPIFMHIFILILQIIIKKFNKIMKKFRKNNKKLKDDLYN